MPRSSGTDAGFVEHLSEEEVLAMDELSDAESVYEDVVPQQKVEIDNKIALERIRDTIKLPSSLPWTETLAVTYSETIEADVDDDLKRELAFYKQALHGAQLAKSLATKHGLAFTRPPDYFAEMVKSDAHMERIRQRLLDESATIKRSEDKRKEREGKKFGKQVQMEKLQERERSKKDMEERLKGLKRKRKDTLDNAKGDDDGFDVAVEDAISDHPSKRAKGAGPAGKKIPRQARDQKFGFGGPRKWSKQNTKSSTDNFDAGGAGRGKKSSSSSSSSKGGKSAKGAAKRPGKGRRMTARSRS
ncbi:eukaryotic rRNA processing [Fomitopsis betulina]|nr:eukaryotic rRNA processing [Fomitopsis betulina]